MDFSVQSYNESEFKSRIKRLYPEIKDSNYPTKWSTKEKWTHISLSQDNLKASYNGPGKSHKDAASVRSNHSIPQNCGIYYFEIKIISKGRDGYMGIGLSAQTVNLNRLPGWDKLSFGYHGDDGHSFCSSGTGQPYGPTFTTGDVIGCCVNMINDTCFYTKNGVNIGVAFKELPSAPLYPMIGLQTPREEISANFGQYPFMFDIEDYIQECKENIKFTIENQFVSDDNGQFQTVLHKLISGYLIHHGYAATAEAFASKVNSEWGEHNEDMFSIKNRQKLQKLILMGRLGEAVTLTKQLFPGLLDKNKTLYFQLKVQQFIEIVNGTDSEVKSLIHGGKTEPRPEFSTSNGDSWNVNNLNGVTSSKDNTSNSLSMPPPSLPRSIVAGDSCRPSSLLESRSSESDSEMETDSEDQIYFSNSNNTQSNGNESAVKKVNPQRQRVMSNGVSNGTVSKQEETEVEKKCMETEMHASTRQLCGGNQLAIRHMLEFGRDLLLLKNEIDNDTLPSKNILEDAFSLLAYSDPKHSPVGYQLSPSQREPICKALNSAILESQNLPRSPPLLMAIAHSQQCLKKLNGNNVGASAYVSVADYL